jgi:hypothetical protein
MMAVFPMETALPQRDSAKKSPATAVLLSAMFPGAGSLYAGNERHALIHGAIDVASVFAMGSMLADTCDPSCSTPRQAAGAGAFVAALVNYVWSIRTAARDADAYNVAVALPLVSDSVTSSDRPKPSASSFGFHGMHLGFGLGTSPYLDQWTGAQTAEMRLGVSLLRDWTFTYAHSEVSSRKETDYFVRECNEGRGCYPAVAVGADAFELQRRWHREHRVHPIAAASVGTLVSKYVYYRGPGIVFEPAAWDSTQYRQFASVSAGLEADVWGWFHGVAYGGYRQSTGGTVPNGKSSNSGPILAWLVEIGKF